MIAPIRSRSSRCFRRVKMSATSGPQVVFNREEFATKFFDKLLEFFNEYDENVQPNRDEEASESAASRPNVEKFKSEFVKEIRYMLGTALESYGERKCMPLMDEEGRKRVAEGTLYQITKKPKCEVSVAGSSKLRLEPDNNSSPESLSLESDDEYDDANELSMAEFIQRTKNSFLKANAQFERAHQKNYARQLISVAESNLPIKFSLQEYGIPDRSTARKRN